MYPMFGYTSVHGNPYQSGEKHRSRHVDSGADGGVSYQTATKAILMCLQSVQKWGNRRANLYWEQHLKSGHVPAEQ